MSWSSGSWDEPGKSGRDPAEEAGSRRDEVRRAVIELVRTRRAVAEDQERLDGYLRDVCPNQPGEVAVVVVAARAGVSDDLSHATEGHAVDATVARLASRLHSEAGVDRELARWAVETWAVALGRMADGAAPTVPMEVPLAPAVTAPPPAAPVAPDGEALRALVARPAIAPLYSDPPDAEPPRTSQPAPTVEATTRLPPAPPPAPAPLPPPTEELTPLAPSRGRPRFLVPAAAVAVLALVALVVALSGGGDEPSAAPPETAPATTATTVAPRPFPADTGPLAAATYITTSFKPAMTMTLGPSWRIGDAETPELVSISRTDGASGAINVVHLSRVFPSSATHRTVAEAALPGATQPVPADVAAWLAANPNLTTARPAPTSIPGVTGSQIEVTVKSGYDTVLCAGSCVPLWPFDERRLGYGFLAAGKRYVVHALDVSGEKVLVILVANADQFTAFATEAERVLASISFPK